MDQENFEIWVVGYSSTPVKICNEGFVDDIPGGMMGIATNCTIQRINDQCLMIDQDPTNITGRPQRIWICTKGYVPTL